MKNCEFTVKCDSPRVEVSNKNTFCPFVNNKTKIMWQNNVCNSHLNKSDLFWCVEQQLKTFSARNTLKIMKLISTSQITVISLVVLTCQTLSSNGQSTEHHHGEPSQPPQTQQGSGFGGLLSGSIYFNFLVKLQIFFEWQSLLK